MLNLQGELGERVRKPDQLLGSESGRARVLKHIRSQLEMVKDGQGRAGWIEISLQHWENGFGGVKKSKREGHPADYCGSRDCDGTITNVFPLPAKNIARIAPQ